MGDNLVSVMTRMSGQTWPTLMAMPQSRAFRRGEPGAVYVVATKEWDEPSALERERAMGFYDNATKAPGVTELQRRRILGNAMDMHTLAWLLAACKVLGFTKGPVHPTYPDVGITNPAARCTCCCCRWWLHSLIDLT